jgi:hypothetical protein
MAFAMPAQAQGDGSEVPIPDWVPIGFQVGAGKMKGILNTKTVTKTYTFEPNFSNEPFLSTPAWAEVEVFKWDLLAGNTVTIHKFISLNSITQSFNTFKGMAQVNQAAGLVNNQGNVFAASITDLPPQVFYSDVSMVEASLGLNNYENEVTLKDSVLADNIVSSFNSFLGLAQVNQAAGTLNNQNNVMALGANLGGHGYVAENDTFLGMHNTGNIIDVIPVGGTVSGAQTKVITTATISDSFNAYNGVAQVNQAPGSLNNQANIVSIAYAGHQGQGQPPVVPPE